MKTKALRADRLGMSLISNWTCVIGSRYMFCKKRLKQALP